MTSTVRTATRAANAAWFNRALLLKAYENTFALGGTCVPNQTKRFPSIHPIWPGAPKEFLLPNTPASAVALAMSRERNHQPKGYKMAIGTVRLFNASKGFGFISLEGGGKGVFVH